MNIRLNDMIMETENLNLLRCDKEDEERGEKYPIIYKYESFTSANSSLIDRDDDDGNNDNGHDNGGYIDCKIIHKHYDHHDEKDYDKHYQLELQSQHDYHAKNRFIILPLVAITPLGVKFFKAAQSSFQEYLMNDPRIMMSATTYSLMLSLMSVPVVTLIGGVLLDYNHRRGRRRENTEEQCCTATFFDPERFSCLGTTRTPSNSAIAFLGISLLGVIVYGYGLEVMNNQTVALIGATIFGLGEGCVVVASRTFVAHAFYGRDGAFAQGVLIASNNLAMVASKIIIPWLVEESNKNIVMAASESSTSHNNDNDISIGIAACCVAMLISLGAGILYALWFGVPPREMVQREHYYSEPQHAGEPSGETSERKKVKDQVISKSIVTSMTAYCQKLPQTFWLVAVARAIFVVTFKVFSHNSNSILMEKFGVGAVSAGRKSSLHEMFALLSPLVGYLAYRSPGGIVMWLFGAAVLGTISIASITYLPADTIRDLLPGGVLTPMAGISIAHGIFIPICIAAIPLTVPEEQLGTAFAVVEVLGSIFSLTNIVFGWLRDATGYYRAPMELLFVYSLVGTCLVWVSRRYINLQHPNE